MHTLENTPTDASLFNDSSSFFFISEVLALDDSYFTCYCPHTDSNVRCQRSFSLLININIGDVVMVVLYNQSYIITSIINSKSNEIFINSHLLTHLKSPGFFVQSTNLSLNSKHLFINALSSKFIFGIMSISTKTLKFYSNYISSLVKLAVSHFNHRVIKNSGNDVLIADQIHLKATQLLRQKSHLIQINAESYVLVDGKKVLLG
jgi:hypothetical protein